MTKYRLINLSSETPEADQSKLTSNLENVKGVERVQLHLDTSEISISSGEAKMPTKDAIKQAVTKAGFKVSSRV